MMNKLFELKIFDNLNIYVLKSIKLALYILAAIIIYRVLKFILEKLLRNRFSSKYLRRNKKLEMLFSILVNILKYLVYFIAILLILKDIFNFNPALIVTATGVLGIAFGLGIQGVLRDFVSGLSILFEDQFNIGDYIEFLNIRGRVLNISIKNVTIEGPDGNIRIVSNGIINKITKYKNKTEQARFNIYSPGKKKDISKLYIQLKENYLKFYPDKINRIGKLSQGSRIGKFMHVYFYVDIKPFNETVIDSIKDLIQKNITDVTVTIDRGIPEA